MERAAPPRLAVSLGDPSGIGAEVLVAALAAGAAGDARVTIFGDRCLLERAAGLVGATLPSSARVVEVGALEPADAPWGRPTAAGGRAQVGYLERAVDALLAGDADALVTAPISKAGARAGGFGFPGHTEYLAARAGGAAVVMMLAGPRLRVALATTHLPLAAVPRALTVEGIARAAVLPASLLAARLGGRRPRVAVCGLNPHAGEGGLFGDEEARLVAPAIALARAELERAGVGAEVTGPHVPDAVFRDAAAGAHDVVVALYHDQGLIPVKLVDFDEAVNVTLGLPFVRTSPDHGVAYDLAGTGRARPASMAAALRLAVDLARRPAR